VCLSCSDTDVFNVDYCRDLEIWVRGSSRSLKMVLFDSLGTVYYSHSIATVAVSVAVSTQYTNVTDRHSAGQPLHNGVGCAYIHSIARQKPTDELSD